VKKLIADGLAGGLVDVAEVVDGRQGQDFVHLGKDVGHTVAHVWDSIF
jgi:hypothetical protein